MPPSQPPHWAGVLVLVGLAFIVVAAGYFTYQSLV